MLASGEITWEFYQIPLDLRSQVHYAVNNVFTSAEKNVVYLMMMSMLEMLDDKNILFIAFVIFRIFSDHSEPPRQLPG